MKYCSCISCYPKSFVSNAATFVGLLPLIFEKSTQAQFLIPMAVSLGFGIMFATIITLFLIPVLYLFMAHLSRKHDQFAVQNEIENEKPMVKDSV